MLCTLMGLCLSSPIFTANPSHSRWKSLRPDVTAMVRVGSGGEVVRRAGERRQTLSGCKYDHYDSGITGLRSQDCKWPLVLGKGR